MSDTTTMTTSNTDDQKTGIFRNMNTTLNTITRDIMVNEILSHLYPPDLLKVMKTCSELRIIVKENEKHIDKICQHIQPHGEHKKFYSGSSQLRFQKYYKDGKVDGEYKKWYRNGQLFIQSYYKDGKLDGEYKDWFENGQLWFQESYKDGKLDGEKKQWLENGQLYGQQFFEEGRPHGEHKIWFERNGQLWIQESYKDGKLDGEKKQWLENGQLEVQKYFKDGKTRWRI